VQTNKLDLPLLTTATQVHALNAAEAARHYPVRIKGVVTSSPRIRLQDATRGSYLDNWASLTNFQPEVGTVYEIEGTTTTGSFAPNVVPTNATFVGMGRLPRPIHPSYNQLMSLSDCTIWQKWKA